MRDPSDYFYLYFITFISISSLILSIFYDMEAKKEIKQLIEKFKNRGRKND